MINYTIELDQPAYSGNNWSIFVRDKNDKVIWSFPYSPDYKTASEVKDAIAELITVLEEQIGGNNGTN